MNFHTSLERTVRTHVSGIDSCDAINVRGWNTSSDNSLSVNLLSIGECSMMNRVSSAMIATLSFTMNTSEWGLLELSVGLGNPFKWYVSPWLYNSVSSDVCVLPCEQ